MKPRINIITLGTRNLETSTKFYQHGLEFPKMGFAGDISFFTLNGSWLALYPWELLAKDASLPAAGFGSGSGSTASSSLVSGPEFRGFTLAHNVETDEQVVELLDKAKAAGATIIKPAQKTDWGGFSGYFADLDGHLWEVAHNPFFWPGPKDDDEKSNNNGHN